MADKKVPLSIVLQAVDHATATVKKVNDSINRLTGGAQLKAFGEGLKGLGKEAGLPEVSKAFEGVGGAVKNALGSLLGIGSVIGTVGLALFHLVDEFDNLGDTADKLGVNVDFLTSMRYATERSGAAAEQFDAGIKTLTENLGQAKAGTGRMTAFLQKVSPALLVQLKATKDSEQAFLLLSDAMAKIPDAARRLALAQKTVGDSDLAPLLARGSAGLLELRGTFAGLAGSQEAAAAGAGEVDDSLKDLSAASLGIKSALLEGLSPALKQIVDELRSWFTENRERIGEWATQFGKTLPETIHVFAEKLLATVDKITGFVDAIGGLKTVALVIAAVILGPLIASIVSLSVTLYTNPIFLIITAIAVAALLIVKYWEPIKGFFRALWDGIKKVFWIAFDFVKDLFFKYHPVGWIITYWGPIKETFGQIWDGVKSVFGSAWDYIQGIVYKIVGAVSWVVDKAKWLGETLGIIDTTPAAPISQAELATGASAGGGGGGDARVSVDFANAPRGTRATADPKNTAPVDLSMGYQMGGLGGVI